MMVYNLHGQRLTELEEFYYLLRCPAEEIYLSPNYRDEVIAKGITSEERIRFIGNGSRPEELRQLREKVGDGKLIWTPGVNLAVGDGEMGQRYGHPAEAVNAGSDCIIVGSGIHGASNPAEMAKKYSQASWDALVERD